MFLCACCNYLGQWDKFSTFIVPKKGKVGSEKAHAHDISINAANEVLEKIRHSTYQLKTLSENTFCNILKDFALPVCIYLKYLAYNFLIFISL